MKSHLQRRVLLAQLPIPPLGPGTVRGNVPLAAAYLKLFAHQRGLADAFDIEILPAVLANTLGDRALVAAIADREPWIVGFTCYVWNIERTLWICRELKRDRPELRIVLGGPEITPDNQWVLDSPDYDYAVIGEGEQTFAELLMMLRDGPTGQSRHSLPLVGEATSAIPGLYIPPTTGPRYDPTRRPARREPMPDINPLGSPYLAGILDATEESSLLLETTRGCVFNCKFCYYPKSYDKQYYLAPDLIRASLRHARDKGVREVFMLDPTLNQRKDFAEFLTILAEENPGQRFRYFGELRGEGITEKTARLLRDANFAEVEVGLQSVGPDAMDLMDRKNNLRAFERGVRAMMAEGIEVKVDLIVGLPGDTVESVRRGMRYLRDNGLFSDVQVFNLAILPGTAFRHEAEELGLRFQLRPPYYVTRTPALSTTDLFGLLQEAQEVFETEFDAPLPPVLERLSPDEIWRIDLDTKFVPPSPSLPRQTFTIWLSGSDLDQHRSAIESAVRETLAREPYSTLQVVLESKTAPVSSALLEAVTSACHEHPTYLDKYYALQPGGLRGAKRIVLLMPSAWRSRLAADWVEAVTNRWASIVWSGLDGDEGFGANEYAWPNREEETQLAATDETHRLS
jgi:radical SAM superfamily enzyme YgiQ (UPF0313 family)